MRALVLALLLGIAPLALQAEAVVAGLSQNRVSITANFDGSEILIFGAVKREVPIRTDANLQVIITVSGPTAPVVMRRKSRDFGIWINGEAVEIDHAPSFYAVATSAPLDDILSQTEDLRHRVSVERAIRSVGVPIDVSDAPAFTSALIRIRGKAGLYQLHEGAVRLYEDTLFDTNVALPANLTEGIYRARIFLTRGKQVIDVHETEIVVRKVGLERFLFNVAHDQPLAYGILALVIAISAGWGASSIFRYLRG